MEPTVEELEKIYSQYNTEELIHLATKSAHHLRPEAQVVIRSMLRAKNVDPAVLEGMDLMLRPPDESKINEQIELLRSLPCPICANNSAPLNAVLASRAISFVIMTNYERRPVIGCVACLEKRCNKRIPCIRACWLVGLPLGTHSYHPSPCPELWSEKPHALWRTYRDSRRLCRGKHGQDRSIQERPGQVAGGDQRSRCEVCGHGSSKLCSLRWND
jgi:hypothetical protein